MKKLIERIKSNKKQTVVLGLIALVIITAAILTFSLGVGDNKVDTSQAGTESSEPEFKIGDPFSLLDEEIEHFKTLETAFDATEKLISTTTPTVTFVDEKVEIVIKLDDIETFLDVDIYNPGLSGELTEEDLAAEDDRFDEISAYGDNYLLPVELEKGQGNSLVLAYNMLRVARNAPFDINNPLSAIEFKSVFRRTENGFSYISLNEVPKSGIIEYVDMSMLIDGYDLDVIYLSHSLSSIYHCGAELMYTSSRHDEDLFEREFTFQNGDEIVVTINGYYIVEYECDQETFDTIAATYDWYGYNH